ncbi:MAG TPA: dicarboxylate/amino acid:cation symporter [Patescibacteria group bacterium]|nr:dicarboxylate/amino acid:cation symporter [Patescibacteria group bacterium]
MQKRSVALHTKIFIGLFIGLVAGLICNLTFPQHPALMWGIANIAYPVGQVFLRMIFMIIIPLIFTALVLGIADLGDIRTIGRIGFKTLAFTVVITAISVIIGIGLANTVQPGRGIDPVGRDMLLHTLSGNTSVSKIVTSAGEAKTPVQTLLDFIPRNPLQDMVFAFDPGYKGGGLLAVMFFALVFGIAMVMSNSERTEFLKKALEGLYDVIMKIIDFAMKLAPYAVAALIFSTVAQLGFSVIAILLKYVIVVILALAIHQFITYGFILQFAAKRNPIAFFKNLREVMLTAFSTSSSNATLPKALKDSREKLGIHPDISSFVLTVGSTANQNGTALYEGITVLFLAQFYGIDLNFGQQMTVVFMSILAGVGTAGVPGGSLPLIVMVLQTVGIPPEGIGVILGVDRILDMSRTVVNVSGDITLAAWVDSSERKLVS